MEEKALVTQAELLQADGLVERTDSPIERTVMFSSLQPDSIENQMILANAALGGNPTVSELRERDEEFVVTDIFYETRPSVDEATGELTILPIISFINRATGDIVVSPGSKGVLNSLRTLSDPSIFGSAPWNPAVRMKTIERRTKNGYKTTVLTVTGRG